MGGRFQRGRRGQVPGRGGAGFSGRAGCYGFEGVGGDALFPRFSNLAVVRGDAGNSSKEKSKKISFPNQKSTYALGHKTQNAGHENLSKLLRIGP